MKIESIPYALTICKVPSVKDIDLDDGFFFIGRTDQEVSLVCRTESTPGSAVAREDGWRGFRVKGVLDFSLTGILSELSGRLADAGIGIFAVSTYNTDYILVKDRDFDRAMSVLDIGRGPRQASVAGSAPPGQETLSRGAGSCKEGVQQNTSRTIWKRKEAEYVGRREGRGR